MSKDEVLLFDIGGVLLTNGWDRGSRIRAIAAFGLDEGFEARHKALSEDLDCGRITLEAYVDRAALDRPRTFDRREFIAFMEAESHANQEELAVLGELAASGRYLIAALNNESRELNRHRIDRFGLSAYFDVFLSSCYLGVAKPDPAIFLRALDLLQRPAAACVFVDDRAENVASALQVGLRAIHHRPAQLRAELLGAGVR